jgi:hypothetical protein
MVATPLFPAAPMMSKVGFVMIGTPFLYKKLLGLGD